MGLKSHAPAKRAALRAVLPLAGAFALTGANEPGTLDIHVQNVASSQGRVVIRVCQESEWLKPCRIERSAPAVQGTTTVTITNAPQGSFGITAFHDRNGNGAFDRNFVGMPKEAIGFSNNALKGISKPKFTDAAITLSGGRQSTTLRLRSF